MFKRLVIAIILLGLVVGGIVWFKFFRDDMIAGFLAGMKPAPAPVSTELVEAVTWRPGVEAVGTSLAARGVDLAIESGGLVRELHFKANDKITEGQHLLQIDDDSEKASLAAAEASLSVAITSATRAQTLQERGVGAVNTVETADAQAESARAQVAQVQTMLDAKRLTAPFSGVIGIPRVEVGEWVTPGTIYATLQDASQMRVDFAVPEQQIAALEMGRALTVQTEVGDFSAEGRITGIEPLVDPNSRLVTVRATVENQNGNILPGQFLRVRIALPEESNVIAVPQTAVMSSLYGDSIYVIRKGDTEEELKAEQVFVTIGRRAGGRIEVIKGIEVGDQIVTSGQNRLTSGARVKIDNSVDMTPSVAN